MRSATPAANGLSKPFRASANWKQMTAYERDFELRQWNSMDDQQRCRHVNDLQRASARMDQMQELLSAARDGKASEVIRCLDEYHLKVNGRLPALDIVALPGSQSSPLHEAVVGGTQAHLEVVELLLERGADVEARDRDGMTPLLLAIAYDFQPIAFALLAHGVDVEARHSSGHTYLHKAVVYNRPEIISRLIHKHHAQIHAIDSLGDTPIDLAHAMEHDTCAAVLAKIDRIQHATRRMMNASKLKL